MCATVKPCKNNGTCVDGQCSTCSFGCICPKGWGGGSCSIPTSATCATANTCVHGSCSNIKNGGISCTCESGWTGSLCQNPVQSNYFYP